MTAERIDDPALRQRLLDFVTEEARLADESRYQEWEALWADDAVYWVPRGPGEHDPARSVSHIYDNRKRLATRIAQLATGHRYSQVPPSPMRRVMSNFEYFREDDGRYRIECNFFLPEYSIQSVHEYRLWSGRMHYVVSEADGALRLHRKTIVLSNGDEPIPTLSFIL